MPNKNYLKGRRKEYAVCDLFKKKGYDIVQRTAGSHSPFDIIAISIKNREIQLIQCKPSSLTIKSFTRIMEENKELNGLFNVSFVVI